MSIPQIQEGALFAGRYRIVRCLSRGGMGAVYEAVHLETERRRALKVILPEVLSETVRQRFRQEARVCAQIESDHIVDVSDAGVDQATDLPFLVMELLRGEELGVRLERLGRFSAEEVVRYLHQTALALDKTHRANIVHRDLKPANLFLSERDEGAPRVKILDFGIAKLIAGGAAEAGATQSVGTPLYMAPEQLLPCGVAPATDIYALGQLAYTFLVGAPYWRDERQAGDLYALLLRVAEGPKEPPSARAARAGVALPAAFDAWFARMTSRDPADRPLPATAAVRALANALMIPGTPSGEAWPVASPGSSWPSASDRAPRLGPVPALEAPGGPVSPVRGASGSSSPAAEAAKPNEGGSTEGSVAHTQRASVRRRPLGLAATAGLAGLSLGLVAGALALLFPVVQVTRPLASPRAESSAFARIVAAISSAQGHADRPAPAAMAVPSGAASPLPAPSAPSTTRPAPPQRRPAAPPAAPGRRAPPATPPEAASEDSLYSRH